MIETSEHGQEAPNYRLSVASNEDAGNEDARNKVEEGLTHLRNLAQFLDRQNRYTTSSLMGRREDIQGIKQYERSLPEYTIGPGIYEVKYRLVELDVLHAACDRYYSYNPPSEPIMKKPNFIAMLLYGKDRRDFFDLLSKTLGLGDRDEFTYEEIDRAFFDKRNGMIEDTLEDSSMFPPVDWQPIVKGLIDNTFPLESLKKPFSSQKWFGKLEATEDLYKTLGAYYFAMQDKVREQIINIKQTVITSVGDRQRRQVFGDSEITHMVRRIVGSQDDVRSIFLGELRNVLQGAFDRDRDYAIDKLIEFDW